jgi:hypothetical protein
MSTPAVLRIPVSCGEFIAQWPNTVCVADLETMRVMFVACMEGWAVGVGRLTRQRDDADAEYDSWMPIATQAPAQGEAHG